VGNFAFGLELGRKNQYCVELGTEGMGKLGACEFDFLAFTWGGARGRSLLLYPALRLELNFCSAASFYAACGVKSYKDSSSLLWQSSNGMYWL
jgi:hypothetical protein